MVLYQAPVPPASIFVQSNKIPECGVNLAMTQENKHLHKQFYMHHN